MEVKDYISVGKLNEALSLVTSTVQQYPSDITQRNLLWELLCIAGEWERADNQLDIISMQDPEMVIRTSLYRWLIRAEQLRRDCFNSGALPEFIDNPTLTQQAVLKALIERRNGNMEKALQFLEEASRLAPTINGKCNNKDFKGLRDCDDWCAFFLEVITSKGKYYWIPFTLIAELKIYPPEYPIDLIWRRASLFLHGGMDGEIYLPAIYIETPKEYEMAKLGYQTDWIIKENHPVSGIGQRLFIIGDSEISIMEIEQLTITTN